MTPPPEKKIGTFVWMLLISMSNEDTFKFVDCTVTTVYYIMYNVNPLHNVSPSYNVSELCNVM